MFKIFLPHSSITIQTDFSIWIGRSCLMKLSYGSSVSTSTLPLDIGFEALMMLFRGSGVSDFEATSRAQNTWL